MPPLTVLPRPGEPLLTARLELRALVPADAGELFALHADPRAFAHDSTRPLRDRAQMQWVLGQWIAQREAQGFGYAAIRERAGVRSVGGPVEGDPVEDSAALVGVAGLTRRAAQDAPERTVLSAYYRLRPEAWGRGIAQEAMEALLTELGRALPGAEAQVVTDADNTPSRRLAERLGFRTVVDGDPVVLSRRLGSGFGDRDALGDGPRGGQESR